MQLGIFRFFVFVILNFFALVATGATTQTLPIDVVDFQQYRAHQGYLAKSASHKVFVVSVNMQPGSGFGWGNSIEEATKYAQYACKDKFRWSCEVVSVNGKIVGDTRTVPAEIIAPKENKNPNIESLSSEAKGLFSEYPYTNMYSTAPMHKAFATNNFGRNGSGHGRGYITEEIAIEKAMFHCQMSVDTTKQTHKKTPCLLVAVNDRLIPDNIEKVLAQTELGPTAIETGDFSEPWHGTYAMEIPELRPELALTENDRLMIVFGATGFQLKKGKEIMSSGSYQKAGNRLELTTKIGQDPGMRKVIFSDDGKTIGFEEEGLSELRFIKQ
jgi:hypothetical protein